MKARGNIYLKKKRNVLKETIKERLITNNDEVSQYHKVKMIYKDEINVKDR